jgi:DNA/RNA endonuclease YhcR with UshA esterase domain
MQHLLFVAVGVMAFGAVAGATEATFHVPPGEPRMALTPAEARDRIGRRVTVEGVVSEVHFAERATFIDLDGRYPNEQFTGVIFAGDGFAFPDVGVLRGRRIAITGTVQLYRGRPEIVLTSANQVRSE